MAKTKIVVNTKCWQDCGETGSLIIVGRNVRLYSHSRKLAVYKKIKHTITIKPSNCLYPREIESMFTQRNKNYVHSETCVGMFIETLVIVPNWKQNTNVLKWVNG